MAPKQRKDYTTEQKAEAVRIALQADTSIAQVARSLGIAQNTLSNWVRQARVDNGELTGPTAPLSTDERQELTRLRRENRQLQLERDFLKKAAAFFAKEHL